MSDDRVLCDLCGEIVDYATGCHCTSLHNRLHLLLASVRSCKDQASSIQAWLTASALDEAADKVIVAMYCIQNEGK